MLRRRITVGLLLLALAGTTMGQDSCGTETGNDNDEPTAGDTSTEDREEARERKRERRAEKRRAAKRRAKKRRQREKRERQSRVTPPAAPPPKETGEDCHPSYEGACLDPNASDYDCAGGSGDGPEYVEGPIRVVGSDPYELDTGGEPGVACER